MAGSGTIIIKFPKGDKIPKHDFAAYGDTEGAVGHVTGVLKNKQGTVVATGKTLMDPSPQSPHWAISFENVANGEYTLEVSGVGAAKPATSTFCVEVLDRERVEKGADKPVREVLNTSYPAPDTTFPSNTFVVCGTSDQAFPVSGQMMDPTIGVFFGTTLQGPPQSSAWYIRFAGLPHGDKYALTVVDTEGAVSQTVPLHVP
jgi:hypothetical protein